MTKLTYIVRSKSVENSLVRLQILAKKTHPASRMFENIITQSRKKYNK